MAVSPSSAVVPPNGTCSPNSCRFTSPPTASPAETKRAILLSACGTTTYKLLKSLVAPAELTMKYFAELVKLAQEHHNPKPSVIMRRFRFNTQPPPTNSKQKAKEPETHKMDGGTDVRSSTSALPNTSPPTERTLSTTTFLRWELIRRWTPTWQLLR